MAPLLDVDLEEVAQVVERWAGLTEQPLLLDRGRLGVALGYNQPAQGRAMLARNLLPHRLAQCIAKTDPAVGHRLCEKDPPPVIRHLDHAIARPALGIDRGGG